MNFPRRLPLNDAPLPVMRAAAAWLARRDRGLTAAERAAFAAWLAEAPEHGAAVAQLSLASARFDRLQELAPEGPVRPDPDLLAPVRRRRPRVLAIALGLAAAAAVAVALLPLGAGRKADARQYATAAHGYQRITLADGSVADLNAGTDLDVDLGGMERRVRLVRGEAHFHVAKNPARPFIVSAGPVAVRAVGTAFDVRYDPAAVDVVVTEGKVQVTNQPGAAAPADFKSAGWAHATPVAAGHQIVVALRSPDAAVHVTPVTVAEIGRRLAWQPRLQEWKETRLGDVITEFNLYAIDHQMPGLSVADPALSDLRIGGRFYVDQADAFVRLLESSFGVTAVRQGNTIVLRASGAAGH